MGYTRRFVVFGLAVVACWVCTVQAGDLESIVFQAGNVGPTGAPAATGWQLFNTNGVPNEAQAVIENVPDRTFLTGNIANKEALVLHPWLEYDPLNGGPGTFRGTVFGHGAEWNVADDLGGASAQTVSPGKIVYLQTEIFSDFAGGGQFWKLGTAVGFRGNADPAFRGFNNEGALGDNNKQLITSVEADWVYGGNDGFDYNGQIKGSDRAERQNGSRYLAPPTAAELDRTYISTAIFRQGADSALAFVGTETEIKEEMDNRNGGESAVAVDPVWGGNTNVITGMVLNRAQVNVLRGSDNVTSVTRVDAHSSFVDPFSLDSSDPLFIDKAVLGIRSFRVGVADRTDVNLDGVTNAADKAIVMANQGFTDPVTGGGATFFEGDVDNDRDVDPADLAFYTLAGDFNGDIALDCADINALTTAVATGGSVATFDLNGDNVLSILDVDAWRAAAGSVNIGPGRVYRVGDANLDGVTDGSDFGIWNSNKFTNGTNWCSGNFNADGVIDGSDFGLWNSNKFTSADGSAVVPEPGLLMLLAPALVYFGISRKVLRRA
jgi:hypothetical protein